LWHAGIDRRVRLVLICVLTFAAAAACLASPPAADAIPGLTKRSDTQTNSEPSKRGHVTCPDHHYPGHLLVTAEAPGLARFPWTLKAYALCAPISTFNNYSIKAAIAHVSPSERFAAVEAVCPSNTVAWGSGAHAYKPANDALPTPTGQLGLQLMPGSAWRRPRLGEPGPGARGQMRLVRTGRCSGHQPAAWPSLRGSEPAR
jgi:hypothetical protein